MAEQPELYKITSIDADGVPVVVYAVSPDHRMTKKMMMSEYGNADIEQIAVEDAPEEIQQRILTTD
jgi:hypothetical protein